MPSSTYMFGLKLLIISFLCETGYGYPLCDEFEYGSTHVVEYAHNFDSREQLHFCWTLNAVEMCNCYTDEPLECFDNANQDENVNCTIKNSTTKSVLLHLELADVSKINAGNMPSQSVVSLILYDVNYATEKQIYACNLVNFKRNLELHCKYYPLGDSVQIDCVGTEPYPKCNCSFEVMFRNHLIKTLLQPTYNYTDVGSTGNFFTQCSLIIPLQTMLHGRYFYKVTMFPTSSLRKGLGVKASGNFTLDLPKVYLLKCNDVVKIGVSFICVCSWENIENILNKNLYWSINNTIAKKDEYHAVLHTEVYSNKSVFLCVGEDVIGFKSQVEYTPHVQIGDDILTKSNSSTQNTSRDKNADAGFSTENIITIGCTIGVALPTIITVTVFIVFWKRNRTSYDAATHEELLQMTQMQS